MPNDTTMHICYALRNTQNKYSKFVGTAIYSLVSNTDTNVKIHLLHDETLDNDEKGKFIHLCQSINADIEFYPLHEIASDYLSRIVSSIDENVINRYSVASFYRLLLGYVLDENIEKVIYLDADTLVVNDLRKLWDTDLQGHTLAAVPEVACTGGSITVNDKPLITSGYVLKENYFNSGVLLINTKILRSYTDKFFTIGLGKICELKLPYLDQDIMNYFFSQDYLHLENKFNIYVDVVRVVKDLHPKDPYIYHYVSHATASCLKDDHFDKLFFSSFVKTPWCTGDALNRCFYLWNEDLNARLILFVSILSAVTKRTIKLLIDRRYREISHSIFANYEIYTIQINNNIVDLNFMIDILKCNENISFIIVSKFYDKIKNILCYNNFKENVQFFDGMKLLKPIGFDILLSM